MQAAVRAGNIGIPTEDVPTIISAPIHSGFRHVATPCIGTPCEVSAHGPFRGVHPQEGEAISFHA